MKYTGSLLALTLCCHPVEAGPIADRFATGVLGMVRGGHPVVYWFDEKDTVGSVSFSYPYERKDELLGSLVSTFGAPSRKWTAGRQSLVGWRDGDNGMWILFKTTLTPNHGIAWLSIHRPD